MVPNLHLDVEIFCLMRAASRTGDRFLASLKDCIRLKDLEGGCAVHRALDQNGLLHTNPFMCSKLVDMYVKCGSLSKAQEVFDTLSCQDVVTWTALISGYAQSEDGGEKALSCFKSMQLEGVCPNAHTFSCILKVCGCMRESECGKEIHATIFYDGVLLENLFVASALVHMYAKCGNFVEAERVLNGLSARDAVAWTALISGYVDYDHSMEALNCFEQMHHDRVSPCAVTYSCVLKACGIVGDKEKGKHTHSEIVKRDYLRRELVLSHSLIDMYANCGLLAEAKNVFDHTEARDVVSWTTLIAGYVDHELGEEACLCFTAMQNEGISPDACTFACCLKACGSIGAAGKGEEVHVEIRRAGLGNGDLVLGSALVDMYVKCGLLDKAHMVFDTLPVRDQMLWTSLVKGYSQHGDVENVLYIFERMRGDGHEPQSVVFVSVINACTHAGLVEKGRVCYETMQKDFGIKPTLQHHACMVDLYSRAGRLEEAIEMLNSSPCHPNMVMLSTILGACRKRNNLEVGIQAFQQALGLGKQETSAYIGMYYLYAEAYP